MKMLRTTSRLRAAARVKHRQAALVGDICMLASLTTERKGIERKSTLYYKETPPALRHVRAPCAFLFNFKRVQPLATTDIAEPQRTMKPFLSHTMALIVRKIDGLEVSAALSFAAKFLDATIFYPMRIQKAAFLSTLELPKNMKISILLYTAASSTKNTKKTKELISNSFHSLLFVSIS